MNYRHKRKWLSNQEYQTILRKRQVIEEFYNFLEEIDGRPIRRPKYGFPFDLMAGGINKGLNAFESGVDKVVLKALTKLKKHKQVRKR